VFLTGKQIVVAIQTLLDVNSLTTNVTGQLKAAKEELEASSALVNHADKLYLSEEAWEEKWKLREGSDDGNGSSNRGGDRGANRGRGRGRGNGGNDRNFNGSSLSGPGKVGRDQCRKCGKKGHWARDYRSKPKETAYTAQEEESLMLVIASPQVKIEPQSGTVQALAAVAQDDGKARVDGTVVHIVHLHEERVFAHLGEKEEHDSKSWICDTGATNHMSSSQAAFIELDMAVRGTVRFGDDSMTEIEGKGTMEFLCKNGECHSFVRVYFIPRLTANIVNVEQLDEAGYDIHIKGGKMDIYEPGGCLLARIERKQSRLYVFDVNIAWRAACMSTWAEAKCWHARLGHVNMPVLRRMATQEVVRGLPSLELVEGVCEACMIGK
jgi:hypothetical protein